MDEDEDEVRHLWKIFGKDIIRDVDGYFVFWPSRRYGCYNQHTLRNIATLLELASATWDKKLKYNLEERLRNVIR